MGKHTAYWEQYTRAQVRGSLRLLAVIFGWILLVILLALAQGVLGAFFPFLLGAAAIGLIVSVVLLAKDAYKVTCPECRSVYRRTKWGGQCPSCGLKLLQPEL